ncbi:MAG TPA: hypothetical protein VGZ90_09975 [Puia sp.]|jgi:hypothetical protein|nr:hypothetical protein [Puia sp.]
MKLFIRNLMLFTITCLIAFAVLVTIEKTILNNMGQFKLSMGVKYIFMGHSHPQMDYNDKLIDSSVNLASSGEAYFYTYIKLKKILESNSDKKIVFVEFSNNNIISQMNKWIWNDIYIYDRYRLYWSYTPNTERKLLYTKNPEASILCDIKSVVTNVYYIFSLKNIAKDERMGGYLHLERDKTDSLLQASLIYARNKRPDMSISPVNLMYLRKIIQICKDNGTKVILIRSPLHPVYDEFKNESRYEEVLNSQFNDVEFLDLKNFPMINSDYGDLEHLNYRGAKKYSLFFNKLLKEGLLDSADKQKFINDQMALEKWQN